MRNILTIILVSIIEIGFCQSNEDQNQTELINKDTVSFTALVDLSWATKDGIWINGYVVNIDYNKAKRLDGKVIRVSGIVTIEKGLEKQPEEIENGTNLIRQGRNMDTKHIVSPEIEIIEK